MIRSPLQVEPLFTMGPVPVTEAFLTALGVTLTLAAAAYASTRGLKRFPGKWQAFIELLVTGIERQIRDLCGEPPAGLVPLIGTLFIFLVTSNLLSVVPLVEAPTARLETAAALALIVLLSVHFYGIATRGLRGHLRRYIEPRVFLLPLNVFSEITQTFSLMMRLFGNMMSAQFLGAVLAALTGLLLPIPFMVLDLIIGLLQAYIFSVLAAVYISAALSSQESAQSQQATGAKSP